MKNKYINLDSLTDEILINDILENDDSIFIDNMIKKSSDATITGKIFKKEDNSIILSLNISKEFEFTCFKCLDLVKFEMLHGIESNINDYEEYIDSNIIDLEKLIIDEILLNVPSSVICSDACKGLCYICGKNRNKQKCTCQNLDYEDADEINAFAKLTKIISNNEEV